MSRDVRLAVMWAIRDCRTLSAPEKALLWAIESRGTHYGTWQTVAADAGMKKDAYYDHRRTLERRGVLRVTKRPGRTSVNEVNADWFADETIAVIPNDPSGIAESTIAVIPNDPSGNAGMEGNCEGDPRRGLPRELSIQPIGGTYIAGWVEPEGMNAWERAEWRASLPVS